MAGACFLLICSIFGPGSTSHNHRKDEERRRVADRNSMPPYLSLEMNDDDSTSYARSGTHHGKHAMMLSTNPWNPEASPSGAPTMIDRQSGHPGCCGGTEYSQKHVSIDVTMQVDVSFQARHAQRECFGSMHVFHNLHRVWKRRLIRAHHWPEHSGDAEPSIRRSQLTCCIGKSAGPRALPSPASASRLMPPCAIVDLGI